MARASSSMEMNKSAAVVWNLIGGFGSLPDWLPYIPKSELGNGGRTRRLANPDGTEIIERLMAFDEVGRSYTYHILKAPFPVEDYYSTLKVTALGESRSRVEWSGEFTPKGVSDQDASQVFERIYNDGLKALAERLAI